MLDYLKKCGCVPLSDAPFNDADRLVLAQAAYLNNIPYLIVRAISDKADDSASMDYSEFEARAVENSVRLMAAMIEAM